MARAVINRLFRLPYLQMSLHWLVNRTQTTNSLLTRYKFFQIRSDLTVCDSIKLISLHTQKERLEVEFIKLSESHDLIRRAVNLERMVEVILLPKETTAKTPRKNLERRYVFNFKLI